MAGAAMPLWAAGDWHWNLLLLLTVPALVLLNAFFVAAEFALVAVRKTQVEEMLREGRRGAGTLQRQVQRLDRSIAAAQLGITIASLLLGWLGELSVAGLLLPLFDFLTPVWQGVAAHSLATATALFLVTFLHAVLGEQVPKVMALQKPDVIALWTSIPLEVFTRLTRPLVVVMNATANAVVRLLGFHAVTGEQMVHSVEELTMLVSETEEAGLLSADQAAYVQNVFRLAQKKVRDCMVPREKMGALELHTPPDQVVDAARQDAHTRLPVYDGDINNIVGIVNTKDLLYFSTLQGVAVLDDAIYPAIYLKPDQPISDALRLFKRAHRQMAMVRDDDGKILGLITLEDIVEEIVGDIEDEHDFPSPKVKLARSSAAAPRKPTVPKKT